MEQTTSRCDQSSGVYRWYHVSSERMGMALFAIILALVVSERFQWFSFNHISGMTALIAVGIGGAGSVLLAAWIGGQYILRHRELINGRTLVALAGAIVVPGVWFCGEIKRAQEQDRTVEWLVHHGGIVQYEHQFDGLRYGDIGAPVPGPAWLRRKLGNDYFTRAVLLRVRNPRLDDISFVTKLPKLRNVGIFDTPISDLLPLSQLEDLRILGLHGTQVTDLTPLERLRELEWLSIKDTPISDLLPLTRLSSLKTLNVENCPVSEEHVEWFRRARPDCTVYAANK